MKLNPKQIKFCELYHQTGNATRSYIDAGYSAKNEDVASVLSSRLLGNDKVSEYLASLQKTASESSKVTIERIMEATARIAFSDLNDIVQVLDGELVLKETAEDLNQLDGISANKAVSSSSGKNGDSHSVSTSFSIKRAERLKALDMLTRMIGGYEQRSGDNSTILRNNAPRVLDALKRYRERTKKPIDNGAETE